MKLRIYSLLILSIVCLIAGGLISLKLLQKEPWQLPANAPVVQKVAIFTLPGCGTCNTALDVVQMMETSQTTLEYDYYNIAEDTEEVNRRGVTEHPTLLFLNEAGEELGRLEKNVDHTAITQKLEQLSSGEVNRSAHSAGNEMNTSELITLYAPSKTEGKYVPVSQYAAMNSAVRYPRIQALNLLFSLNDGQLPARLQFDMLDSVSFVEIRNEGDTAVVELSEDFAALASSDSGRYLQEAIALTLGELHTPKVQIVAGSFRGQPIYADKLTKLIEADPTYTVDSTEHHSPGKGIAEYNTAILHGEELRHIPCFCGCGSAGHTSNLNCYFDALPNGMLQLTNHAEYCQVCLDITSMFRSQRQDGAPLSAIRESIDQNYSGYESTDTPYPVS